MQIIKTRQSAWGERLETLKQQIQYWVDNSTQKTVEIVDPDDFNFLITFS